MFPGCFLIPFILEPLFANWLPFHLNALLVRSHPEIRRENAEVAMQLPPMDMGRYADILLNVLLSMLMFFFPGGYVRRTLIAFLLCHMYIYVYDHYRVLRAVPAFHFSSNVIDNCAMKVFSVPCGLLLACLIFKANCRPGFPCAGGWALVLRLVGAFLDSHYNISQSLCCSSNVVHGQPCSLASFFRQQLRQQKMCSFPT